MENKVYKRVFLATIALGLFIASCGTIRQARAKHVEPEWIKMLESYNETVEEKDKISCEKRTPIGSNIPGWYCGTVAYWKKVQQLREMNAIEPEVTASYIVQSSD